MLRAPRRYFEEPRITRGRHVGRQRCAVLAVDLCRDPFEGGTVVEDPDHLSIVPLAVDPDDGAAVEQRLGGPLLPELAHGGVHVAADDVELLVVNL